MRILHLASYNGNIGDNASASGVRHLYGLHDYTSLEVRDFIWWGREWDYDLINSYDMFLIGGGGYLDLCRDGCALDFDPYKIKILIILHGMGCDDRQATPERVKGFKKFVHSLLDNGAKIFLRNDGSLETVQKYLPYNFAEVKDGGFFAEVRHFHSFRAKVAINIAGDMLDIRYPHNNFLQEMASLIVDFEDVVLVPHIYKDLYIISDLLKLLPDKANRTKVTVAPYLHGDMWDYNFDIYRKCDITLGMRFHANVVPLGMGCKVIGLVNYPQVQRLYEKMGLDNYVDVTAVGWSYKVKELMGVV